MNWEANEPNPYASPLAEPVDAELVDGDLPVWRLGRDLVLLKGAPLPPLCIKSGEPADYRLKLTLYWHHPLVYLAFLVNILVYAILALVLRKSAKVEIPLSEPYRQRRRWSIVLGVLGSFAALALIVFGSIMLDRRDNSLSVALMISGWLLLLVALLVGLLGARMVTPKKITDRYVVLRGAGEPFLATLPDFPLRQVP